MSNHAPRNPLVRPIPQSLFARELARFWPRLTNPEAALEEHIQTEGTRRFQVDLLAMDEQQRIVLLDIKWELPGHR
jgi:hypothetical protein